MSGTASTIHDVDCVVVGAGFSGMYAIYRLREDGLTVRGFEAGNEVGGVWNWNKYPGAQCDVPGRDYSYSFSKELQEDWVWSRKFPSQPEILAYAKHVADRFDLRKHISFETRVETLHYNEKTGVWTVSTSRGETLTARFCVMTCGHLSTPNIPDLPGMKDFKGQAYHTGRWPEQPVDFRGKRVAVVGVGSSGVQIIPQIARTAEHLTVFQRTPQFAIPLKNHDLDQEQEDEFKRGYPEYRQMVKQVYPQAFYAYSKPRPSVAADDPKTREAIFEELWENGGPARFLRGGYLDTLSNKESNDLLADFVRRKIASIVKDQAVAEKLKPYDHPIGTKRLVYDESGYYQTYNRPNVSLVDLREMPLASITEKGIRTSDREHEFDIIVFATGYDAFTGTLFRIDIRGRDNLSFRDKWKDGPVNYLGLAVSDFPNMFIVEGPGSPSVFANVIAGAEQQIEWISRCIQDLANSGAYAIEADAGAEARWAKHCSDVAAATLLPLANSWWIGANIAGKTRIFYPYVGGMINYRKACDDTADNNYEGFRRHFENQRPSAKQAIG